MRGSSRSGGAALIQTLAMSSMLGLGCQPPPVVDTPPVATAIVTATPSATPPPPPVAIPRGRYNTLAAELALPLFWEKDGNGNGAADPGEVAVLWGLDDTRREDWVTGGAFTDRYRQALASMEERFARPAAEGDARRALVIEELAQGLPTLVRSDLRGASAEDKALVRHVMAAAELIEQIHQKQLGSFHLRDKLQPGDPASRALYFRNHAPWCVAPKTEKDPACNAIPGSPPKLSGLYPANLQASKTFCDDLKKQPDAEKLRHQFFVVREKDHKLVAVPYHEEYRAEMTAISQELTAAADAIVSAEEKALQTYLRAAAKAFTDDSWPAADEAWAKMSVHNSKWYLRIGPDEVYFEPCSLKAGFHVSFARINQDSLRWQKKLGPVRDLMEDVIAKLAGPPYKKRAVSFHLPDFIDIVLNAGDSRSPHGATIGQSLPNWGPVANEGRGRTVAMTNLYTDPDSQAVLRKQASSLLCADTMALYVDSQEPMIMSTVMHEAAHNLGPSHEYKVKGKTAREIFGGPLASTLEELKAQSAALFLPGFLESQKQLIGPELVKQAHVRDFVWGFGHISRGMYDAGGKPKPYSQLAAIQLGWLMSEGVVGWRAEEKIGDDTGCFSIDTGPKYQGAAERLLRVVARTKASGDTKMAAKLRADFVDAEPAKKLLEVIRERWLRAPKASFVYAIEL